MPKLELTDSHIAILAECLGSGPYKIVAPVIEEIRKQLVEQEQAGENVKAAESKK